jgi:hypothetical protein
MFAEGAKPNVQQLLLHPLHPIDSDILWARRRPYYISRCSRLIGLPLWVPDFAGLSLYLELFLMS